MKKRKYVSPSTLVVETEATRVIAFSVERADYDSGSWDESSGFGGSRSDYGSGSWDESGGFGGSRSDYGSGSWDED